MGATAAIALTAFGGGLTGIGQINRGRAEKRLADYNAAAVEREGEFAAQDAIERGRETVDIFRLNIRKLIGEQRASYAGQNVEVNSGTPLEVQADTARQAELDVITVRANAAKEAWGLRRRARTEARSIRLGGKLARSEGYQRGIGTIIGTGGGILAQKYGFGD